MQVLLRTNEFTDGVKVIPVTVGESAPAELRLSLLRGELTQLALAYRGRVYLGRLCATRAQPAALVQIVPKTKGTQEPPSPPPPPPPRGPKRPTAQPAHGRASGGGGSGFSGGFALINGQLYYCVYKTGSTDALGCVSAETSSSSSSNRDGGSGPYGAS